MGFLKIHVKLILNCPQAHAIVCKKLGSSSLGKGRNRGELICHELAPIYEDVRNIFDCLKVWKPQKATV